MNALAVSARRRCGHDIACCGASLSFTTDTPRRRCHRLPRTIAHCNLHASTRHHQQHQQQQQQQLRIAIVGGGPAGMTAALHLSPLVAAGLIAGPVDVYEQLSTNHLDYDDKLHALKRSGGRQDYPGAGALGRNVGVGLWSTAWWPFLHSIQDGMTTMRNEVVSTIADNAISAAVRKEKDRLSYRKLLHDLEHSGSYVGEVGYRTPNGDWLVESELNSTPFGIDDLLQQQQTLSNLNDNDDPALLFLRERDLLSCLHTAINVEQELGTINYHSAVKVEGIANVDGDSGSLILQRCGEKNADDNDGPPSVTSISEQRYNLIISADGLYSPLRSRFAGYATSTNPRQTVNEWEQMHRLSDEGHRVATMVEERGYVVFRGNAPRFVGTDDDSLRSFQTWGESRAMRFAAVPFKTNNGIKKDEIVVWFATMSSDIIDKEKLDATQRKALLLEAFGSWHEPIRNLIDTTPADEIMYESAIAHRFTANPVFDVARIIEFESWQQQQHMTQSKRDDDRKINGNGPILVFIGDAMMSIDLVLAQGITIAMESAASIVQSIENALLVGSTSNVDATVSSSSIYHPNILRKELLARNVRREQRLLYLLRSTELVQQLAQPSSKFGSILSTWIVRPIVKLCPDVVKVKVFDYYKRYSLGLTGG
jgi:2-polyprenyl-6-methoxyphenol hydroxylase-like FAD-dependent oxidoreductase